MKWTGENTVYSTWTQEGLIGPRRGERLELASALWGITTWETFQQRHAEVDRCELWIGDETLGVGCEDACRRIQQECPSQLGQPCNPLCEQLPRHFVDCLRHVPECDFEQCDLPNVTPDGTGR